MRPVPAVRAAVAALAVWAANTPAQGSRRTDPSAAELAIALGRLDEAEGALYERVRRYPDEPSARGELGAFLAGRGQLLAGVALLHEALHFGADTADVEARLFEVHRWGGRYDRAAVLQTVRISRAERTSFARAAGTIAGGRDSATVALEPNDLAGLGRVEVVVAGQPLSVDIAALETGVTLPSTMSLFGAIEPVGASGDTTFGVARSLSVGGVALGPVPVRLTPSVRTGRIGLDVLAQLQPTIDGSRRTLTVRSRAVEVAGTRHPILLTFPGVTFIARPGQAPVALHAAAGRAALRGLRWTLDLTRGAIVVSP